MTSNRFRSSRPAGLALCVIISAVWPLVAAQDHVHYTRSELHRMMREANTPEQCRILATWFREEEATFREKAEAENRDYEHYKVRAATKVPTRADNARSLRDYYSEKANHMAALATRYETRLAELDLSYRPVTGTASRTAVTPMTTTPASSSQNEKMLLERIEELERQVGECRPQ